MYIVHTGTAVAQLLNQHDAVCVEKEPPNQHAAASLSLSVSLCLDLHRRARTYRYIILVPCTSYYVLCTLYLVHSTSYYGRVRAPSCASTRTIAIHIVVYYNVREDSRVLRCTM